MPYNNSKALLLHLAQEARGLRTTGQLLAFCQSAWSRTLATAVAEPGTIGTISSWWRLLLV